MNEHGFAFAIGVLSPTDREELLDALGPIEGAGRRGLLATPQVRALACSERLLALVRPHLPAPPRAVRAIYFDKPPDANWLVAWHQDLALAVAARVEAPGFGAWSVKDGVPHVHPPVEFLERMLAVRIHLDDADEGNGALRVLPGTHRRGRLTAAEVEQLRGAVPESTCVASAGDAMLMRPLLLHASSRSTSDRRRRVLHIEYAGFHLPAGLAWHEGA